jgi:hypothetical protein
MDVEDQVMSDDRISDLIRIEEAARMGNIREWGTSQSADFEKSSREEKRRSRSISDLRPCGAELKLSHGQRCSAPATVLAEE